MTTTTADTELKPCACGCGELVRGTWKRGHKLRADKAKANALTLLPGPDDDLDAGESDPDPLPGADDGDGFDVPDWLNEISEDLGAPTDFVSQPDPPPGRIGGTGRSPGRGKPKGPRVTVAIRRDVEAKIRFALMPAGGIWSARDPLCGGTFAQQEPEISAALAELVCDSPDLLNWFTGPAGGFMKYFRLLMAVQPVALMVWGHHVAHAVEVPAGGQQSQQMHPEWAA